MSYNDLSSHMPQVAVQTETESVQLDSQAGYAWRDIRVELVREADRLRVYLTAENTPVCRVWLSWEGGVSAQARILGDAWERGYGDLEWRGVVPERILPWYVIAEENDGVSCYGVETGAGAMCSWRADHARIRLCLDVRNGGSGVVLGGRRLNAAAILCGQYVQGQSAYEAACDFCRRMCPKPRLADHPVYGGNNWYYAYGDSSHEQILTDARLMAEVTEGFRDRPYVVIDDGWQAAHCRGYNGGPWERGNEDFPDMQALAQEMRALGVHPGIWFRPLLTEAEYPQECLLHRLHSETGKVLDPSHPQVLADVEAMTRQLSDWGYELIKHDFTTYDIYGRWGFRMGYDMTDSGWHFHDRSKTTAEIILNLYRAIRRGAGEKSIVIGCNTVSHLAAGLFELQRTGDDTSGREWERTRKMGVNTLAFRMPQHGAFYAADADCVGATKDVDWQRTREWMRLLCVSGTPMFLSIDPEAVTPEQKDEIRAALRKGLQVRQAAEPLNWMDTTCPDLWQTQEGEMRFDLPCEE